MNHLSVHQIYLDTLLQYYEEEISGETYFYALANHFEQKTALNLLARVERHAAEAVEPLLTYYDLTPRSATELAQEGLQSVSRHASMTWSEFVQYMVDRYPRYLDDFAVLENMAPEADLALLQKLTAHEVAAIEFANMERNGISDSCAPLRLYLSS